MITISESFAVPAEPEAVLAVLADPAAVAGCIDGAELGEQYDDGSFAASLAVRFGPLRVKFHARIALSIDEENREGHITAQGKDAQGGTRVKATATFAVAEAPAGPGAVVTASGEVVLSGKLAPVVEAGASVVVRHQTDEFAENLAALFQPEQAAAAVPPEVGPQRAAAGDRWYRRLAAVLRRWLRGDSTQEKDAIHEYRGVR
jgi:carbon monoxide dehydrogenase subunit G